MRGNLLLSTATFWAVLVFSLFILSTGTFAAPVETVFNTLDSGPGSLRGALADVDPGGTVNFQLPGAPPYTITVQSPIIIDREVTIVGLGADVLTISGNDSSRIFTINDEDDLMLGDIIVSISGIRFLDGNALQGGAIWLKEEHELSVDSCIFESNEASNGGAIFSEGTIKSIESTVFLMNEASQNGGAIFSDRRGAFDKISHSRFSDNNSTRNGGAIYTDDDSGNAEDVRTIETTIFENNDADSGGAIYIESNRSMISISHTIFRENMAAEAGGAILNSESSLIDGITNCTFYLNVAETEGGAILNEGTINISFTTIYKNTAEDDVEDVGGGIYNFGTVNIKGSIVGDNPGGDCFEDGTITAVGNNLDTDDTCPGFLTEASINLDPDGPQDNGGPLETIALCTAMNIPTAGCADISPAIDAAADCNDLQMTPQAVTVDKRFFPRPINITGTPMAMCDLGAFEAQPTGMLSILKIGPLGAEGFEFAGMGLPIGCPLEEFTLDTNETEMCILPEGNFTVEEILSPGFELVEIVCDKDPVEITDTSVEINIEGGDDVTCSFENEFRPTLNLNFVGNGGGTVNLSPPDTDCTTNCSEQYDTGTNVSLTPTADDDSIFTGFSGDEGCGPNINITKNLNCTATFTLKQFNLTVGIIGDGEGAVTSSPAGIDCGADCSEVHNINTVVTLTPTPRFVSKFAGWTGDPDCSDGVVTMDADMICTAEFMSTAPNPISANLSVVKSASPDPVQTGSELTYSFEINNAGPNAAPGVQLTDVLPPGVSFVSASPGCVNNNGTVNCSLSTFSVGETRTVTIVVIPTESGVITNSATINSGARDSNPSNNTSIIMTEVVGEDTAFLSVESEEQSVNTEPGESFSITVEISNQNGSQTNSLIDTRATAAGVVFSVNPSDEFVIEDLIASRGTCDTNTLECVIGEIFEGETVSVAVDALAPEEEGIFDLVFSALTNSGETFNGSTRVDVQGGGSDDGSGGGGCALSSTSPESTDIFGLLAPLMLLPLVLILRRKRRLN